MFPHSQHHFLALFSELRAEGGVDHNIGGRVQGDEKRVDVKQLQLPRRERDRGGLADALLVQHHDDAKKTRPSGCDTPGR